MSAPVANRPADAHSEEIALGDPAVSDPAAMFEPPPYPVRRFTVAEYEAIARAGILNEDDNVELLEGWIVPKMTKHPPHDSTIDLVNYVLGKLLPPGWYTRVQNSAVTADSVPEPDVVVVRGKPGDYHDRHPGGSDVGLIVEVSDSTVSRDRRKARIYSRAGVPCYWIINLDQRQVEVYSQPALEGTAMTYKSRNVLRNDDLLTLILDGQAIGTVLVRDVII